VAQRIGIAVVAAVALAAWSVDVPGTTRRAPDSATPMQEPPGRALYEGKGNCATCHGKDGRGTPLGPDLTDSVWLNVDGTEPSVAQLIRTGVLKPKQYPTPMPPMGGARLRAAEIEAIARYVVSLRAPTH
jgi:mono/diheme cytochrome c family protein